MSRTKQTEVVRSGPFQPNVGDILVVDLSERGPTTVTFLMVQKVNFRLCIYYTFHTRFCFHIQYLSMGQNLTHSELLNSSIRIRRIRA